MAGKWLLAVALANLPSRREAAATLRSRILDIVKRRSGLTEADVQRESGASRSSVRYHLRALEASGVLASHTHTRQRRYFPGGSDPDAMAERSVLERGRAKELLREILLDPGISQSELVERTGLTRKVLNEYVELLEMAGFLESNRDGRFRRYHPGGDLTMHFEAQPETDLWLAPQRP